MLNIPEQVKSLFNRDDIRKNIRITFPQSGRPDITNDNIVAESLSFSESVCSQSTFRYGLAESSVIEFETVGVANMLGETIEAYIEIDATTLPAEMQTSRDDLTFPVYPVPLGRFVVTACPRNHEAMAHRKATAYSRLNADEALVDGALFRTVKHPIPAPRDVSCEVAITYDRLPEAFGYKAADETFTPYLTDTTGWVGNSNDRGGLRLRRDGVEYVFYIQGSSSTLSPIGFRFISLGIASTQAALFSSKALPKQAFFSAEFPKPDAVNIETIAQQAGASFWNYYKRQNPVLKRSPSDPNPITATEADFIEGFKNVLTSEAFMPSLEIEIVPNAGGVTSDVYNGPMTNAYPESMPLPTCRGNKYTLYYYFRARYGLTLSANVSGWSPILAVTPEFQSEHPTLEATLYAALPQVEPYNAYTIKIPTADTGEKLLPSRDTSITFDQQIMQVLAGASLEMSGAFGCFTRDTGAKYQKLLTVEPAMRLERGQYSSAWWDEFDLAPVGAVAYKIGSNDNAYQFGEGTSVYDLSYAKVFETMGITSAATINELLDKALVPELQKLMYTPVEIDAHGLPYLEAGDCIELEADDGTIIKTYVLERKLTGIQNLRDQITADGITIAEVDV